jgi:1-acyl-sn-glycerol-3-phosphate acyltransferase
VVAYFVLKALLTPILRTLFRVRAEGLRWVPRRGPAILASNHLSFSDSIFLPLVLRRRVTFVAKAEYFEDRRKAWFFRATGQIPIKRTGGSASEGALAAAREVLASGGLFGIYPEGTRSPDGRLYKGHTGVARLALSCRVPVIAVAMVGTDAVQPIGRVLPRPFRTVTVRFSRPMRFDHLADRRDDPLVLREVTDEIMYEIRALSGQEYVDRYAKRHAPEAAGADEARVSSTTPAEPDEAGAAPLVAAR